jgi:diguanylate cyclase (GGDEF)-like protein
VATLFGEKRVDNQKQHPGLVQPKSGRRIALWVYGLAALLICLSAASLTFIAHLAWREADRRALESEQLRFESTLADIHREVVQDQIALAQWDKTFNALQYPIDRDFIEVELADYLWGDYSLNQNFLIDHDGTLIAHLIEDKTDIGSKELTSDNVVSKLAEKTGIAFSQKLSNSASLFSGWYLPENELLDISASSFAEINGRPAFLSAVPILPDDASVELDAEYPPVLVSAIYLDDDWISELNEHLSFKDLVFFEGAPEDSNPTNHLVTATDGTVLGHFQWDHAKPGREIWLTALPLIGLLAAFIGIVAIAAANRISRLTASLEESERRNHHFARHDALTGLPNRHHFSDCLAYSLDSLPDGRFAVIACDLDHFKPVNDNHGHEAGDRVLCCIADRLQIVVGDQGIVSRIGGDEFIILITQTMDRKRLQALCDQIRTTIAIPVDIGEGRSVEIGVSLGVACAPECGTTEKDLFRMADTALYQAKDRGRNTFAFAPTQVDHSNNEKNKASG